MSVLLPYRVQCVCGDAFTVSVAESVNADRAPQLREQILRGAFHRGHCPCCRRVTTVEKPFYYTDLRRGMIARVHPRAARHQWRHASAVLEYAAAMFPRSVLPRDGTTLRVLFGLDELREKLVAQDLGLDDRDVEMLKALLIHAHPVLLRRARLRLLLERGTEDAYQFIAAYEHHRQRFCVTLPRARASKLLDAPGRLAEWARAAHGSQSIYEIRRDHWMNFWRWSDQPGALARLCESAHALRRGEAIDTGADFVSMIDALPSGNELPDWAKRDLDVVRSFLQRRNAAGDAELLELALERRFGVVADDDWGRIAGAPRTGMLWSLLDLLPDSEVEGNIAIREIEYDESGGAYAEYNSLHARITIGAMKAADATEFAAAVRHEVGHAVHQLHKADVDRWLCEQFGWRSFDGDASGIDAWVAMLGGWPIGSTENQRQTVRDFFIRSFGGREKFVRTPQEPPPDDHPCWLPSFEPRIAFESSGDYWYRQDPPWHRRGGRAFFLNYYYHTLCAVDVGTLEIVDAIDSYPPRYAAMSPSEFFAELYALYRAPSGRARTVLHPDVLGWLDAHLAPPDTLLPDPPGDEPCPPLPNA